jgi:hypothetical protein
MYSNMPLTREKPVARTTVFPAQAASPNDSEKTLTAPKNCWRCPLYCWRYVFAAQLAAPPYENVPIADSIAWIRIFVLYLERRIARKGNGCGILLLEQVRIEGVLSVILPKVRDPRFITIRRGGTLTDADHHLLALWAAACAEHVLYFFELAQPDDLRPRYAIEMARAWVRGEVTMTQARAAGGHAMGAARDLRGAARYAAYAAGQAACVAHVAAHELGAAAYAIKAARAAAPEGEAERAGRRECQWQRDQLPEAIRALVLDDQRLRNDICWSVFDC